MRDASSPARALAIAAADLTLADVLRTQAVVRPHAEALVMGSASLTYLELDALTEKLAAGLVDMGFRRGDRLAVLSRNSLRFALLFHAAAKAGVAVAALNWRSAIPELRKAILLVEPTAIAVGASQIDVCDKLQLPTPRILMDSDDIGGPTISYADLKRAAPRQLSVHSEDIVSIVLTSGTTGDPKAVAISHRALLARAAVFGVDWSLDVGDAFIGWGPLFHISSSDYLFTTPVLGGVFVVVDGFDAREIAAIARSRKIGWLFLVPGTIEKIVEALGSDPLPRGQVKVVGVMADLIASSLRERISELTGARYLNSFGMTETGLIPCSPSFVGSTAETDRSLPKIQSAMCSVKLMTEGGVEAAAGEPGEMWVRSPTLASGYWNNEDATAKAFADGWYHTGDVLRRTPDGALQFVGRLSGLIKSGGENIYPAEIERALLGHPDVTEAAAIGVRDPQWGETPYAFVSLIDGAQISAGELREFLKERIASYKIPREIQIISFADFPRNVTGKVDRKALATRFARVVGE